MTKVTKKLLDRALKGYDSSSVVRLGSGEIEIADHWIRSTSMVLNQIMGDPLKGAFPQGKIIEIYGPRSSAKSMILYDAGYHCQKAGGVFILIDSESSFSVAFGKHLGIDTERLVYVHLRTFEEVFDLCRALPIKLREAGCSGPILIGLDSLAALITASELDKPYVDGRAEMAERARIISRGMRDLTGLYYSHDITFIIINQIRKKLGIMFGNPETRPGGEAVPFHASVGLHVRRTTKLKNKTGAFIGHLVDCIVEKNRVRPPFGSGTFTVWTDKYQHRFGLDRWNGFADILVRDGILTKDRGWYELVDDSSIRFRESDIGKHWKQIKEQLHGDVYAK